MSDLNFEHQILIYMITLLNVYIYFINEKNFYFLNIFRYVKAYPSTKGILLLKVENIYFLAIKLRSIAKYKIRNKN